MSIRVRMIILSLFIVHNYCLTKDSDMTSIGYHNVRLESCRMVVMTSLCAPSWHETVCACALTFFVPYPLHKFILTFSYSYWWIWNISVLTLYHLLSTDYVYIWLVYCFIFIFISMMYPVIFPTVSTLDLILPLYVFLLYYNMSFFELTLTTFPSRSLVECGPICRVSTCFHLMITLQIVLDMAPYRSFVKKYASICSMVHYAIKILLLLTVSLANK